MKRTFVIPALLFLAASAIAQTTCAQSKNPVSTALRDILPGRQKNTVAAVEAMPAEKFSYKPSADQMTFGRLVVHMAETNNLLCGKAAAVPAPKVEEIKDTDSKRQACGRAQGLIRFLLRRAGEYGRFETSGDHGRIRRKTSYTRLVELDPSRCLDRPLRRSRNVSAPERCVVANRQEVKMGSMKCSVCRYAHRP